MIRRLLRRAVVTALVTAAGAAGLGAAPGVAATCTDAGGVSVVVDFRELGGGLSTSCDTAGGTRSAATLFTDHGFALTYVQRQPGFVCRISGVPAADPCVNTPPSSAYWGLYWSNGTSGSWAYSALGAGSLTVPAGGSVAFAWQGQTEGAPSVAAPAYGGGSPTPTPTEKPTPAPTRTPSPTPTTTPSLTPTTAPTPSATPTQAPTPAATRTSTPTPTEKPTRTRATSPTPTVETPSPTASAATDAAPDPEPDAGSVPLPLVLALMALLGALVAGIVVVRSRRT